MIAPEELAAAVRAVLEQNGDYLSTRQVLERLPVRVRLVEQYGSEQNALKEVKQSLMQLQGELSFDFVPSGRKRKLIGTSVPEVTIVFRLRG